MYFNLATLYSDISRWIDLNAKCIILLPVSWPSNMKNKTKQSKKTSWKIQTSIGFDYYQRYFSLSFHSNSVNNWKNECVSRNLFSRNSIKLVNKIHFCTFLLLLLLLKTNGWICIHTKQLQRRKNLIPKYSESKLLLKWNWK